MPSNDFFSSILDDFDLDELLNGLSDHDHDIPSYTDDNIMQPSQALSLQDAGADRSTLTLFVQLIPVLYSVLQCQNNTFLNLILWWN